VDEHPPTQQPKATITDNHSMNTLDEMSTENNFRTTQVTATVAHWEVSPFRAREEIASTLPRQCLGGSPFLPALT